jgi:dihydrofolate reductase
MGKPMIMGRGTFDSIGRRLLPGRQTIILTRDLNAAGAGYLVADSIEQALLVAGDVPEVMIVGGANIYKQFLPLANKMYLSIMQQDYSGDVFFPEYDSKQWCMISEEIKPDFTVQILEKII